MGLIAQDMFLDPKWRTSGDTGFSSSPVEWITDVYCLKGVSADELRFSQMGQILLLGVLPSRNGAKLLTFVKGRNQKQHDQQEEIHLKNNVGKFVAAGLLSFMGLSGEKQKEANPEEDMKIMIKRGILAFQEGNGKKAEQILHVALKFAQDLQHVDGQTYIFDILANIAYDSGDYHKAEKVFKDLIGRLLAAGKAPDDNAIIHISAKLASLYGMMHEDAKAVEGFSFCVNSLQKKIDEGIQDDDTLLLWALSVDWFARFFLLRNQYNQAFHYFEKAYEMSEKINGPAHGQTLVLLNDLGSVCSLKGEYDKAAQYLQQAIDKSTPETEDLPSFYVNLGTVQLQQKLFAQAQASCEQGLRLAQQKHASDVEHEAQECLNEIKKQFS
nr:EOG090X06TI [Lepidurus arcticus]